MGLGRRTQAQAFVLQVRAAFEAERNPAQAEPMARYMRNLFPFLGLKTPQYLALFQPLLKNARPYIDERFLAAAAKALWKLPEREFHHAANELLDRHEKVLTPASLPMLRGLIETNSWWDTVDTLSTRVVGPLVARHPDLQLEMDAWSRDGNFWVRRCAILHQLNYKQETDTVRLFRYCKKNARDEEFFIRKAIGWALRQYARTDPRAVVEFVKAHPELSGLSRREALKSTIIRGLFASPNG